MRVILKTVDVDNIKYDANNLQEVPTGENYSVYGYSNVYRTKIIFNNINLPSILGSKFSKNKTFNIRVVNVNIINDNNNTNGLINSKSLAVYRTSNLYMYSTRLKPINGANEILISQLTNFDPNYEFRIEKMQFLRGYEIDFVHIIRQSEVGNEIFNKFYLSNSPFTSFSFRYENCSATDINNKIAQVNSWYRVHADGAFYFVITSPNNDIPIRISSAQTSRSFDMQIVPQNDAWTVRRLTDDFINDFICEYTYTMPDDYNIDLTFEIRDLLTNKLQPVLGTVAYWPSVEIVLDIF